MASRKVFVLTTALAGGLMAGLALGAQVDPKEPQVSAGVWTQHTYSFTHLGFTSYYSCDGLAAKLKVLLRAAGARADVIATPRGCAAGFGRPDRLVSAELKFSTLTPAVDAPSTPTDGEVALSSPVATVPGYWKTISLGSRKPRELDAGDCELVEEFRDLLLPMFTTAQIQDRMRCVPRQSTLGGLNLSFDAFVAVPVPKAPVPTKP